MDILQHDVLNIEFQSIDCVTVHTRNFSARLPNSLARIVFSTRDFWSSCKKKQLISKGDGEWGLKQISNEQKPVMNIDNIPKWQFFSVLNLQRQAIETDYFIVHLHTPINEIKFVYYKQVKNLKVCFENDGTFHFYHNEEVSVPVIDFRDLPREDAEYEIACFLLGPYGTIRVHTKYFICELFPSAAPTLNDIQYWNTVPNQAIRTVLVGDDLKIEWLFRPGISIILSGKNL